MNEFSAIGVIPRPAIQEEYGHFIGGKWVKSAAGKRIALRNPANGEHLAWIQAGDAADARRAVDAASAAFPSWSQSRPGQRQEILEEMSRRLLARLQDYAVYETLNNGKPISESLHVDIPASAEHFKYYTGVPWEMQGQTYNRPDGLTFTLREPKGVCAQIIPWNVPMIMMAWKVAPAIATGCTVVLKPSEIVCLSVLEFFREMADIIPPGVVNVLTGYGPDVGEALVTDPRVQKVAFTGSQATARKLMQYASVNIIPQSLELGGKSAMIVCEDADIDGAVMSTLRSNVYNKGEVCSAATRIFVHDKIRDQFLEKLIAALARVKIGDPMRPDTQLGPLASEAQFNKVLGYLDLGVQEGAKIVAGGKRATGGDLDSGYYIEPTIFTGVDNGMRIAQEEIFGPVTVVIGWNDEQEVLRQANESQYGLVGGLWTKDLNRAMRFTRGLETGVVWVNKWYNFTGGASGNPYKGSGIGREGGPDAGMENYTNLKMAVINLAEGPPSLTAGH